MPRDLMRELVKVAAQSPKKRAGFTLPFTKLFPKEEGQPSPPPKARRIDLSTAAGLSRVIRANEKSVSTKDQPTRSNAQSKQHGSTSLPAAEVSLDYRHTLTIYQCTLCSYTSTARSAGRAGNRPSIEKHIRKVHARTDWESVMYASGRRYYYIDDTVVEKYFDQDQTGVQAQHDNQPSALATSNSGRDGRGKDRKTKDNRGKAQPPVQGTPNREPTAAARNAEPRKAEKVNHSRQTTLQWTTSEARTQTRTDAQAGKAGGQKMGSTTGNTVATSLTSSVIPSIPMKRQQAIVSDSDDEEEQYVRICNKFQKRK